MAIYSAVSRYQLTDSGQEAVRGDLNAPNYTLYTVREGDTFESISARILGTTERFWELADMNPQIKFPLDIEVGTVLRIPL
jgi:nucleoid-associated protein YgaU